MTEPNVLGGDQYGLKFLFESGDTRIVNLCRPYDSGASAFPQTALSLYEMNSGLSGVQYAVPVGKVFYMLEFMCVTEETDDISLAIQRNSTVNNIALGDNLFQIYWEGSTSARFKYQAIPGGLKFDAADYVTPYDLDEADNFNWSFYCWGVECDA